MRKISFNYSMRKTGFAILVVLLSFPLNAALAQGKTNFTGEWALDENKSELGEGGGFGLSKSLNITQDGNNLNVERTMTSRNGEQRVVKSSYSLDGKESDNSMGNRSSKSTATWSKDGKVLTVNTNTKFERNGQSFESKSVETWKLSDDGKTLTLDMNSSSQRGDRHSVLVYHKKQV